MACEPSVATFSFSISDLDHWTHCFRNRRWTFDRQPLRQCSVERSGSRPFTSFGNCDWLGNLSCLHRSLASLDSFQTTSRSGYGGQHSCHRDSNRSHRCLDPGACQSRVANCPSTPGYRARGWGLSALSHLWFRTGAPGWTHDRNSLLQRALGGAGASIDRRVGVGSGMALGRTSGLRHPRLCAGYRRLDCPLVNPGRTLDQKYSPVTENWLSLGVG